MCAPDGPKIRLGGVRQSAAAACRWGPTTPGRAGHYPSQLAPETRTIAVMNIMIAMPDNTINRSSFCDIRGLGARSEKG